MNEKGNTTRSLTLVPEPYRTWVADKPVVLEGRFNEERRERSVADETQVTKEYLDYTFDKFPQYLALMHTIMNNPVRQHLEDRPQSYENGKAGVKALGRRFIRPMEPECRVSIVIPAKDEQDNIKRTLEFYANQVDEKGAKLDPALYELNVIVNTRESEFRKKGLDGTYNAVVAFSRDNPQIRINALEAIVDDEWGKIGFIRKIGTDIVAIRRLQMNPNNGVKKPLYIQSDDADMDWVDTRQVKTVIDTLDAKPNLDAVVGYQEKNLRVMADVEFVFLSRRIWDLMTTQAFNYLQKGEIDPKKRNFVASRVFTYGTNTAYTLESYSSIGGYDWESTVGEDLDIGHRISLWRGGPNKRGEFVPNIETIGTIRTRSNSSPRRYFYGVLKSNADNIYSDKAFNISEVRTKPIEEMIAHIPSIYKRLTPDTARFFEKELWHLYESLRTMIPDKELSELIMRRSLVIIGFKPEDIKIRGNNIDILNTKNFSKAMEDYRQRKSTQ